MRRSAAALALLLATACSPARRPDPIPVPSPAPAAAPGGDEIVALWGDTPITRREVAEKILELEPRYAIDQYVRWRIVEDRRRELGIRNAPGELERRADALIRTTRDRIGAGPFEKQLAARGLDEAGYRNHLVSTRMLRDMLTLEKIVRYQARVEGTFEIDRMIFADEEDAKTFKAMAERDGFDKAAETMMAGPRRKTLGRIPRETFTRSLPPADPLLDPWIVEALSKMKPGETTGIETSRSNFHYVIRLNRITPGEDAPYARVRSKVLEEILENPPAPGEYRRWIDHEFSSRKIEYSAPGKVK